MYGRPTDGRTGPSSRAVKEELDPTTGGNTPENAAGGSRRHQGEAATGGEGEVHGDDQEGGPTTRKSSRLEEQKTRTAEVTGRGRGGYEVQTQGGRRRGPKSPRRHPPGGDGAGGEEQQAGSADETGAGARSTGKGTKLKPRKGHKDHREIAGTTGAGKIGSLENDRQNEK